MTHLKEGDKAPELIGDVKLADYAGKKLILYFYPKDNTPGCTSQACNLRDNYKGLKAQGYEIIGVSPDNQTKHDAFKAKFELPFHLVPDTEKDLANAYGVWGEKKNYGKTYMGIHRTTFVINEEGIIEKIYTKVKTKEHAEQILA